MLKKEDRIFKNLYGFEPSNLAGAKQRGDWSDTKDILHKDRNQIVDLSQEKLKVFLFL